MARQARGIRSKQKLLDAAGVEFLRRGFAAATMKEMAAQADLTTGAIMFHFPSKEALAREVIIAGEIVAQGVRDRYPTAATGDMLHLTALVELLREWAALIKTNPVVGGAIRLIIERPEFVSDEYESWALWVTKITAMLEPAHAVGELDPAIDTVELADYIAETFTGLQLVSAAATQYEDLLHRFDRSWEMTAPAFLAPEHLSRFHAELRTLRHSLRLDPAPSPNVAVADARVLSTLAP